MAKTLAFLGIDNIRERILPVACARVCAESGARVLLIGQGDHLSSILGQTLTATPTQIQPQLWALEARTTAFLEQSWNRVRALEEEFLRTPFFKNVHGQELGVIPGFDELFLLLALRDWDQQYDVLVLSLSSDQSLLRLLACPEQLGWYVRRFQDAFRSSPISLALTPFLEPLLRAVVAGSMSTQDLGQKGNDITNLIQRAQQAARKQVSLFLVTDQDALRVRQAQRLWGSAELYELQVSGVLDLSLGETTTTWEPLPVQRLGLPQAWSTWLVPNLTQTPTRNPGLMVDPQKLTVRVFLPGFDKKEIELSQDGPELTLRIGDQRRNLVLPNAFRGLRVKGAKFMDGALAITF